MRKIPHPKKKFNFFSKPAGGCNRQSAQSIAPPEFPIPSKSGWNTARCTSILHRNNSVDTNTRQLPGTYNCLKTDQCHANVEQGTVLRTHETHIVWEPLLSFDIFCSDISHASIDKSPISNFCKQTSKSCWTLFYISYNSRIRIRYLEHSPSIPRTLCQPWISIKSVPTFLWVRTGNSKTEYIFLIDLWMVKHC